MGKYIPPKRLELNRLKKAESVEEVIPALITLFTDLDFILRDMERHLLRGVYVTDEIEKTLSEE